MKKPESAEQLDTFWVTLAKANSELQEKLKFLSDEIGSVGVPNDILLALDEVNKSAKSLDDIVPRLGLTGRQG